MAEQVRKPRDEEQEAILFFGFLFAALLGTAIWIAYTRFHVTVPQIVEVSLYLVLALVFVWDVLRYYATASAKRAELWPQATPYVDPLTTRHEMSVCAKDTTILLGHESDRTPFFWSRDSRTMQGICFGKSGAGKTTFLETIAQQDIARGGPMIFIDGKGDAGLFRHVLQSVDAAGRSADLRLIDPSHPEVSVGYNPFWAPNGNPDEHVGFIFESFRMDSHDFFDEHQRVYLENIARVLYYSGKRFNFYDVLVTAYDATTLKRQMKIAMDNAANDKTVSQQSRLTLNMSIHNLLETFEDKERVSKIQGLINHLATFMTEELALITGPYDKLLTLDEVIDNNLIVYMSLNVNVNARAVTALGRILLQNLQLMIGRRYARAQRGVQSPFLSVIMDEFSPFAYENFATIINTARGANVAFLLSLQNAPQLLQVGKGFRNDLSSSPNTTFMLRTTDEETSQLFLNSSARVKQLRRTVRVKKSGFLSAGYQEEDMESRAEVLDTTAKDEHLKKMPTGQMELLMSDHTLGMIHKHVHIQRGIQHYADEIPPAVYPTLNTRRTESAGLHLRFPELKLDQERDDQSRKRGSNRGKRG